MLRAIVQTSDNYAQIRSVAVLGGLQIDLPENYTHYEDNKKPEFLAKFPHGKIPGWEGKDGFLLTEGVPIAKYREHRTSHIPKDIQRL